MIPNAYRQYQAGWTRIERVLALFDGAIERLEQAEGALAKGDEATASPLVARSLVIVSGLAAGLDLSQGELPVNLLRLYEYITHLLHPFSAKSVAEALSLLRTLRVGFVAIRDKANEAEQKGTIPPVEEGPLVLASA